MVEFMRNTDAFTLGMEEDARLRSTVVSIVLLDRSPDWSVLVDRFERVVRLMPMFRQRLEPTLAPAPPRWVYDHDFDLRFHMRRISAPSPGDFDTILEIARRKDMEEFDHARPMWEATLVEGMSDGGAAIIVKLHHSLADGVGGMQVAKILYDLEEKPLDRGPLPPEPKAETLAALHWVRQSIQYDIDQVRNVVWGAAQAAPAALLTGVLRPKDTLRAMAANAASVYRTVRPINETASPIMRDRSLIRELRVHEVATSALKNAGRVGGGTLNDAYLAGVTGGLRRYHAVHHAGVRELNVTMPVNIRSEKDPLGGTRITLMRFSLPVAEVDPLQRIKEIHLRAGAARTEPSLPYTQVIAGGLNLLPRWYIGAILRHVDFLASNVPGMPVPVYLAGAKVRIQYAFGPTIGAGVNITLMSYGDTCAIGINSDTGAIPDPDVFAQCLVEGFDEVLALNSATPRSASTARTKARHAPTTVRASKKPTAAARRTTNQRSSH
jgi:diacylglycerol O-acyltransferase / wax synthase